jgi:uncharacterized protein
MAERKPNRLASEKSPYLLQHAHNPVEWYPWGEEALRKAKNDGKPIFLSIGYSSCHWCHVLEKESFEDESTAALLNKRFIPIKVDREEMPDIDAYYMAAVQAMTGRGGWPLSVFLTPDLKPYYGGTYFPPEPSHGMPSFRQVLEFAANLWKDRREEVLKNSGEVVAAIQARFRPAAKELEGRELIEGGYAELVSSFDTERGGFGTAPKFPLPSYLSFLLRYRFRTGKELALKAVTKTLDEMAKGGIHDQLGGGFHRYSTDRQWLVPHFEKMLYDNALLAKVYLEAYQLTRKDEYARVARDTIDWMLREMEGPAGGFYSAQDADTPDGEGAFYTWTPEELTEVLGPQSSELFCYYYGVTRAGNHEGGRSILSVVHSEGEVAERFGKSPAELSSAIRSAREKAYRARLERRRPATDDKVLTSWNGLALSALAFGYRVLGEQRYLDAAERLAAFVSGTLMREGVLLRRYAGGQAALAGTLEDYAFFASGLLELFEARGSPRWLGLAVDLAERMVGEYWDEEEGAFFLSSDGVPAPIKDGYDGPTPSGNSVAAELLVKLADLLGRDDFRKKAEKTASVFAGEAAENPSAHTRMLSALDLMVNGTREVAVSAETWAEAGKLLGVVRSSFIPDAIIVLSTAETQSALRKMTPLLEGRSPGKEPVAYVCKSFACRLPSRTEAALSKELSS